MRLTETELDNLRKKYANRIHSLKELNEWQELKASMEHQILPKGESWKFEAGYGVYAQSGKDVYCVDNEYDDGNCTECSRWFSSHILLRVDSKIGGDAFICPECIDGRNGTPNQVIGNPH